MGLGDGALVLGHEGVGVLAGEDKGASGEEEEQRGEDGGAGAPDKEGVPLPNPDVADEEDGVVLEQADEVLLGQRKQAGAEEARTGADEREEEQPLQRRHEVEKDLGDDDVEAKDGGHDEHGDGGEADKGVEADDDGEGDAPGEMGDVGVALEGVEDGDQGVVMEELAGAGEGGRHKR